MPPFIIYALPRSRTFWLSRYLTYGDWTCGHDELRHARSLEDVRAWLSQPCTGTVETAASPFWRLVKDIKTVVVRRPVDQVVDSIARLGLAIDRDLMTKHICQYDNKLDQIEARIPGVLSVQYDDLASEETCKQVFEFCLPYQHDHDWWQSTASLNLQVNMRHVLRHYTAYEPQLLKLAKIAKHQMIAGMSRDLPKVDHDDGLVIQEESFEDSYPDATKLMEDHLVIVGEAPDAYASKNIELIQKLADLGNLQIMTARCNGRMFGYLMTIISPSLVSPDITNGAHSVFYADPGFKGLGMKLQRAAIEALRAKGVDELYFHVGVRGDGPRMATVYKRLGAKPNGEWFKLDL